MNRQHHNVESGWTKLLGALLMDEATFDSIYGRTSGGTAQQIAGAIERRRAWEKQVGFADMTATQRAEALRRTNLNGRNRRAKRRTAVRQADGAGETERHTESRVYSMTRNTGNPTFAEVSLVILVLSLAAYAGIGIMLYNDKSRDAALQEEAERSVITSFTDAEERLAADLEELRYREGLTKTYTYVTDTQERLWHVCDSIGYGIGYGTRPANPQRESDPRYDRQSGTVPLAEPHGLPTPTSSAATWLICKAPDGKFSATYLEQPIIVSQTKLNAQNSYTDNTGTDQ